MHADDVDVTSAHVIVAVPPTLAGRIAYDPPVPPSRDQLTQEQKLDTSYLRLRAYPFTKETWDFIDRCDRVYVIEQNRDGQMLSLLKMECNTEQFAKLRSIRHYVGLPIDGRSVTTDLLNQERG